MLKIAIRSALTPLKLACDSKAKLHNDKLENLEKRLSLLEKINSTPTNQSGVLSFSAALTGKSTQQIKQRNQLINVIAQDNRDRILRENNTMFQDYRILTMIKLR